MRFRLIAAALLTLLSANAFAYDASRAPRYASPDMYRPNVDSLTINGPGLTCAPGAACDVGSLKVALPSLATRTLLDRLLERPSIIDYGVDITGVNDSTAALTAALNSGKRVSAPCGTVRLLSTVSITMQALFDGPGNCLKLKYDAPAGTAILPLMDIKSTAAGSRLDGFAFDHQANTKGFTNPTIYGGNLIAGSAILVQADNTSLTRVTGANGWDNCIAVVQLPATANGSGQYPAVPGSPRGYSLQTIRTSGCGIGPYRAGAGVDVASGSSGVVNDLVDRGSYGAFILDIGAGAQGTFTNLTGISTAFDSALFAQNGTRSQTFYIGAGDSTFTNLVSIDAGDRALWLDGFATRNNLNNVYLKTSAAEAALLKSPQATISGLLIDSPGYGKTTGTVDAIVLDASAGALTSLNLINPVVKDTFNKARYGINQVGSGGATGYALGYDFSGAVTESNNLSATFGLINASALGGGWTTYTPTVTFASGTATTLTATGAYRKIGKTVEWRANVNMPNIGTATGAVKLSLPFAVTDITSFNGTEIVNSGAAVPGSAIGGQSIATFKRYDGGSPVANNNYLSLNGTYQTP
jgi:hypothetical protein